VWHHLNFHYILLCSGGGRHRLSLWEQWTSKSACLKSLRHHAPANQTCEYQVVCKPQPGFPMFLHVAEIEDALCRLVNFQVSLNMCDDAQGKQMGQKAGLWGYARSCI